MANVTTVTFKYILAIVFLFPLNMGVDERVQTYSLTYGQSIICFYMMGLGANFTMREVASSANS